MTETIEAFVDKLHADGVQAGREAAEKIRAESEQLAQRLIQEAEAQANKIINHADAESGRIRAKTETELKLAARDSVIRLQEDLNRALQGVLAATVTEKLGDAEFLQGLLRDIVMQYVQADIKGSGAVTINVSEEMRHQLTHWAIEVLRKDLTASGTGVDLHGSLAGAGFEYKASEGTVEVTVESVVEILSEMVGSEVREIVAGALTEANAADSDG